jgi:WS/DGAT/MGAT family acyltransferase
VNPETLDPLDSAFITLESPLAPLHIAAILEFEAPRSGPVDPVTTFDEVKALVAARLHEIPKLSRRILRVPFDLAWPVWIDDPEFDLEEHVIRRACPSPGGEEELDALVGRIMATELPADRPLWEISVVEGLADGRTALILKLHHALADGVSGAATFAQLFDISPEVRPSSALPDVLPAAPAPLPSPLALLGRTAGELIRRPHALLEALASGAEHAGAVLERTLRPPEESGAVAKGQRSDAGLFSAPRTSLNGTPSHARRFTRLHLDLSDVKAAAKQRGATVTDFVLCTVGGALRRLFEARGEVPDKDLVAFMPVNVRAPGNEAALGNRISAALVGLHTTVEDHESRLELLRDDSAVRKAQGMGSSRLLMHLAAAAGPTLASLAGQTFYDLELFNELPPIANVTVSSVPGPPIPLWLAGRHVTNASPMGPLMAGIALNVTVLGYGGLLEYGVLACAKKLPDLSVLKGLLEDEAHLLLKETAAS